MNITRFAHGSSAPQGVNDLLARSSLYREFLAEQEEILKHRGIESEKSGRDVGFESALVNWVVHHRAQWQRSRRGRGCLHLSEE